MAGLTRAVAAFVTLLLLSGCADRRLDTALDPGRAAGLRAQWISAGDFVVLSQSRVRRPGEPLRVYIEGDGLAWLTRSQPSFDPTPVIPLALRLALADRASNIAWLGRPCQYVMMAGVTKDCPQRYWMNYRFAPEIVATIDTAVTKLMAESGARQVELVGYSGGGAIAVLVAARRQDVVALRTVAGNVDHAAFTRYHDVTPMTESLNPVDVVAKIGAIPQIHFAGAGDRVVPPSLIQGFVARVGGSARFVTVPDTDHLDGWSEAWPRLLEIPLPATKH